MNTLNQKVIVMSRTVTNRNVTRCSKATLLILNRKTLPTFTRNFFLALSVAFTVSCANPETANTEKEKLSKDSANQKDSLKATSRDSTISVEALLSEKGSLTTIEWLSKEKRTKVETTKFASESYWKRTLLTADAAIVKTLNGEIQVKGIKLGARKDIESSKTFSSDTPEASAFLTLTEAEELKSAFESLDSLRTTWKLENAANKQAMYDTGRSIKIYVEIDDKKDVFYAEMGSPRPIVIGLTDSEISSNFLQLLSGAISILKTS